MQRGAQEANEESAQNAQHELLTVGASRLTLIVDAINRLNERLARVEELLRQHLKDTP